MLKSHQIKVNKPWGWEIIFTPPEAPTTGKILHLNAGKRFSYQYHEVKEETLCLLKGEAKIILDDQEYEMEPLKGYHITPGMKHRCQGITEADILETSTPEKGKTVRLQDDYNRGDETEETRERERKQSS